MARYTVAVTGATGRVGVHIVQHLLKAGYHVHVLAHSPLPPGHPLLHERVTMTTMNLATLPEQAVRQWLDAVRPDAFIHSAALADVLSCERQPALAYLMNAHVTRMLAKVCATYHIHFIMLSTDYVFGGTAHPEILYHEWDEVGPLNHYGKSKVQGELATQEECGGRTPWTICRTSVVYGLAWGSTQWHRPDFIQWLRAMLVQHETLRIAVDQINSPVYAVDLAKILVALVEQSLYGVYHVAGNTAISRYRFAVEIARCYGLNEGLIQPVLSAELSTSPLRPLNAGLCIDAIRRDSGICPHSLQDGLVAFQELEQAEHMEEPM